jgi:hypothetical protein
MTSGSYASLDWDWAHPVFLSFLFLALLYFVLFCLSVVALRRLFFASVHDNPSSQLAKYPQVMDHVHLFKKRLFSTAAVALLGRAVQLPFVYSAPFSSELAYLIYLYANAYVTYGFFSSFFLVTSYWMELSFMDDPEHLIVRLTRPKRLIQMAIVVFFSNSVLFAVSLTSHLPVLYFLVFQIAFFALAGLLMALLICLSGNKLVSHVHVFARQEHVRKLRMLSLFSSGSFLLRSILECAWIALFLPELADRSAVSRIVLLAFYFLFEYVPTVMTLRFLRPRDHHAKTSRQPLLQSVSKTFMRTETQSTF